MDSREDLGLVCKNPDRAHIFFFWTTSRGLLPKLARYRLDLFERRSDWEEGDLRGGVNYFAKFSINFDLFIGQKFRKKI